MGLTAREWCSMFTDQGNSYQITCACHKQQSFYSKIEHHAVRIFLLILAVIAMYKVVVVETRPELPFTRPPAFEPCESRVSPKPPNRRKRQKKRSHRKSPRYQK
jgi:hypothetical protein